MPPSASVNHDERPVGQPMKNREALEFLVKVVGLNVATLERSGSPSNVADLKHVHGLCYELCRFTQAAWKYYVRLSEFATRNPRVLNQRLGPVRDLFVAIADGEEFMRVLEKGTHVRIFGRHFQSKET